jgi:lactate dehydrogenase-like 2-hydroxyacid dehydrogenase
MISKILSKKLAFFSNYYLSSINSIMSISSYRIFISQPIPNETIKILQDSNKIDFTINDQLPLSRNKLLESVKDCDGIFCTLNDKIDKEVLDHAGDKLKV